ncbi:histidine kinase [Bacillus paralicheniformis]|uniref:hypothetical protein n=1 Tax=Bacillus paralicheniformis TaxID=1648923 RepID=UPI001D053FCA|nr:hypothetical protein [Bacillus paralicheniformis]
MSTILLETRHAGHKIDQYIDQLIHLSKTEEALNIEYKEGAVKPLVENVLNDTEAYIRNKSIDIVLKGQNLEGKKAVFDKQLLHRALMNIMTNAADYTPEGGNRF